jgi:hypothetical protein
MLENTFAHRFEDLFRCHGGFLLLPASGDDPRTALRPWAGVRSSGELSRLRAHAANQAARYA